MRIKKTILSFIIITIFLLIPIFYLKAEEELPLCSELPRGSSANCRVAPPTTNTTTPPLCSEIDPDSYRDKCELESGSIANLGAPTMAVQVLIEELKQARRTGASEEKQVFEYKALETIPGVTVKGKLVDSFNVYIGNVYTFLVSIVGICALFMITVGGYMYLTSAGNTSAIGRAKAIITDSIIGLIIALLSYLIFSTINPALVNPTGLTSLPTRESGTVGLLNTGGVNLVTGGNVPADSRLGSIPVVSSAGCVDPYKAGCTNTSELPNSATDRAVTINNEIPIKITGGAETAGHTSHGPGIDAMDIQPVNGDYDQLGQYLVDNKTSLGITKLCTTPAYSKYRINCTTDEKTNHFHIAGN